MPRARKRERLGPLVEVGDVGGRPQEHRGHGNPWLTAVMVKNEGKVDLRSAEGAETGPGHEERHPLQLVAGGRPQECRGHPTPATRPETRRPGRCRRVSRCPVRSEEKLSVLLS